MIINAVSYARFSSANQREASIEIQQEHINKYCEENGITIIKEYVDRAMSATSDSRPAFQQMIKDAESRMFSYVIVYSSSRFARNIQDHLKYKAILESFGVKIVCINENFDDTTPEGDLMSNFMMSINQFYSKDLARKIYLGCLSSAREGKHMGGVPLYGYSVDENRHYIINKKEAEVVRLIFDLKDKGMSNKQIAEILDKKGIKTRKGFKFRNEFSTMLHNRKYIGEYNWNVNYRKKGKAENDVKTHIKSDVVCIPDAIPAIITKEQFVRVNKRISENGFVRGVGLENRKYLLSSMIRCGNCGFKMNVDFDVNGNGHHSFTRFNYRCCSKIKNRTGCDTKNIRGEFLDTYITNLLFNVLLNERYARNIYRLFRDKTGVEYQKTKNQLVNNQLEIDKIKGEIKNLMNSLAEAKSLAYQEIVREIERLSSVKVKLEEEMEHLKTQIDLMPFYSQSTIESNIIKLKSKIKKKTLEYIRPILRLLIKEIIITNEEIQTKLNLNAYVDEGSLRDFEVVIVENTDSIINPDNQLKQRLSWDALLIRI